MTTSLQPSQLWSSMPGWGIVADLTPPELIASRRLRIIRKLLAAGFALLLVLCIVAYGWAFLKSRTASDALAAENSRTATLQAEQRKYSDVTQMQATVDQVQGQLAGLLAGDVSYAPLIQQLRGSLPPGMTIAQMSLSVNGPTAAAAAAGGPAAAGTSLDTSGHPHIGTVTMAGLSVSLPAVATFVDKLTKLTGVVDVLPPSESAVPAGYAYSITASFTDQLLSHKYDLNKGSK